MLVSMDLSEKFGVPSRLALLYDFLNSVDRRRYVEDGCVHVPSDELGGREACEQWLHLRGLLEADTALDEAEHQALLELREDLRAYVHAGERRERQGRTIDVTVSRYPLRLSESRDGVLELSSATAATVPDMSAVLGELLKLAHSGELARLKMCGSDECGWIFFDRSKPNNRRWCSSARCGNRAKSRAYRKRQHEDLHR